MIRTIIRGILNAFGDENYRFGKGLPYLWLETLASKASKDRQFLETVDFKGKTIYDVCAYIGLLTMLFAKKAGTEGKVIAFEPNPENFSKLLINVAGYPNITPFNVGLGNKHEELNLVASAYSRATGTFEPKRKRMITMSPNKEWTVEIAPSDSINGLPAPYFVKIDVEGFEYEVLEGMRRTLLLHKPILFIEIHGVTLETKRRNVQRLLDFLGDFNYKLVHTETYRSLSSRYMPLTGHVLAYSLDRRKESQGEP